MAKSGPTKRDVAVPHPRVDREGLDERLYLQSLGRALDALDTFGSAHRAKSLNEIASDLGVTKSAAQRTVYTLLAHGYLEKASGTGYRLGRQVLCNSFNFLRMDPLVQRAAPVLTQLRQASNERVDLTLFEETTVIYALRYQSKRESLHTALLGRRLPSFLSAGGRVCLANLSDEVVDDILANSELIASTPRTITSVPEIWSKITAAREDTYAFAQEEAVMGEVEVAAAILDQSGKPVGAVHISGLLSDSDESSFRAQFAPLVLEASRVLGA
ncbi:IclR family transcriptional regulator [Pseudooceanicola lipolyticus]|uniref:IclR family transcriptional regulator n=1 Tax=Pseudooceanicola lipolyticus TaxID=2029104 RepID=A0A2M8J1S8_9RHOB|nr:IclR family transcriptional regulator [Pseudooceanicola lipolyticus]PJE36708.1 IclR family transcriptional regulator [Pseudooceanicola lipolyticus]